MRKLIISSNEDYMKNNDGTCLTCKYYDIYHKGDATDRGFRCTEFYRPMADFESCSRYRRDENRRNYEIYEALYWIEKRGYDPKTDNSYYYIVSLLCQMLRLDNKDEYLNAFAILKDYCSKFPNGQVFLTNYDIIGPKIRMLIEIDDILKKRDISKPSDKFKTTESLRNLVTKYLDPMVNLIKYQNYSGALKIYLSLMYYLSALYLVEIDEKTDQVYQTIYNRDNSLVLHRAK